MATLYPIVQIVMIFIYFNYHLNYNDLRVELTDTYFHSFIYINIFVNQPKSSFTPAV